MLFKKGKIIRQFKEGINSSKSKFERELKEKLNVKLKLIYEDSDRSFIKFYEYTRSEEIKIKPLIDKFKEIDIKFKNLNNEIESSF